MPLLSNKTPYTVLFDKEVYFSAIRTFGCLSYASTLTVNRKKFDPRASPFVFVSYPSGIKGFKLYDIVKKRFIVSRDVLFF